MILKLYRQVFLQCKNLKRIDFSNNPLQDVSPVLLELLRNL